MIATDAPALEHLGRGHHRRACPECAIVKQRRRDTALSVDVSTAGGVYLCFRCGWAGGWRADGAAYSHPNISAGTGRIPAKQHLTLDSYWRDLWRSLGPVSGTGVDYLRARGCALPPADGDLRSTEQLHHPSGHVGPALVALATDTLSGVARTLHRTWIRANGTKPDISPQRLYLSGHRKAGSVIRLWPDEAVTSGLAISEGIETSLAVATVFRPVWSVLDAGNMKSFPLLEGVESLVIVADHDEAGVSAARACGERWNAAGRRARVRIPPEPGTDAADMTRPSP